MEINFLKHVKYAGFWIRFLACIIDSVIVSAVLGAILSYQDLIISPEASKEEVQETLGWISLGVFAAYEIILSASSLQGTLGKAILGLKVTDETGKRMTLSRSIGRYLSKILSWMIFMIGFLMVGWTKRKRGLHDIVAGSYVIYKQQPDILA